MLKLYHDNPDYQQDTVMDEADEELYIIERIIDHRRHKGKREYLIQWKGYDEDENTWEPADTIEQDAPGAVEDYETLLIDEVGTEGGYRE